MNKQISYIILITALLAVCTALTAGQAPGLGESADLVLIHGKIATLDPSRPEVEAVAIEGGRVSAIGTSDAIEKHIGEGTEIIDLNGKRVVPGFIESHAHLLSLGKTAVQLDLVGTSGPEEIAERVRALAAEVAPGQWILGRGWDQNDWEKKEFPTHEPLTRAAPQHPVFLTRIDGHAAWTNRMAIELSGMSQDLQDPTGGHIVRDGRARPTGVFIDTAMDLIRRAIPDMTKSQKMEALKAGIAAAVRHGITTFHDAGAGQEVIDLCKELAAENRLDLRLYLMLDGSDGGLLAAWFDQGPVIGLYDDRLTVRAVKLFADGALGSRGSALIEPYDDDPDNRGLLINTEQELFEKACQSLSAGFQVCTHAIGDRANRVVLDAYERAFNSCPGINDHRFRIEHAQILQESDITRFAKLGVIPSMQPTHCTSDMPWAEDRIGRQRAEIGAYVWRTLLDTGVPLPAGSDAPVESIDPLLGFYAAITRQDHHGKPSGGWYPEQRMSRQEALEAFTTDGAYAAFEEDRKGSLEVGKLADLTVLSRDILSIPEREILDTKVEMTVVAGRVVFKR